MATRDPTGRGERALRVLAAIALAALPAPFRAPDALAGEAFPKAPAEATAAPAACAPRLQVYFASDFKDESYQKKAYQKVASAWKRPAGSPKPGGKAVVIATISRDGKTTPPVLHLESGTRAWDAAAIGAVTQASPFDPLPKSFPGPSVEVHFHFECAS